PTRVALEPARDERRGLRFEIHRSRVGAGSGEARQIPAEHVTREHFGVAGRLVGRNATREQRIARSRDCLGDRHLSWPGGFAPPDPPARLWIAGAPAPRLARFITRPCTGRSIPLAFLPFFARRSRGD